MVKYSAIYTFANFALFQIAWALAVFLQDKAVFGLTLIAYLSWRISPTKWNDLKIITACSLTGILVDNVLFWLGIFEFPSVYIIPAWLILLWVNFTLTLNHSLRWLVNIPKIGAAGLGAVFGTLSYCAGFHFGAVVFPHSLVFTIAILIPLWALLMLGFLEVVKRVNASIVNATT